MSDAHRIPVLPSIINACILTSAWSAGNTYLYVSHFHTDFDTLKS